MGECPRESNIHGSDSTSPDPRDGRPARTWDPVWTLGKDDLIFTQNSRNFLLSENFIICKFFYPTDGDTVGTNDSSTPTPGDPSRPEEKRTSYRGKTTDGSRREGPGPTTEWKDNKSLKLEHVTTQSIFMTYSCGNKSSSSQTQGRVSGVTSAKTVKTYPGGPTQRHVNRCLGPRVSCTGHNKIRKRKTSNVFTTSSLRPFSCLTSVDFQE